MPSIHKDLDGNFTRRAPRPRGRCEYCGQNLCWCRYIGTHEELDKIRSELCEVYAQEGKYTLDLYQHRVKYDRLRSQAVRMKKKRAFRMHKIAEKMLYELRIERTTNSRLLIAALESKDTAKHVDRMWLLEMKGTIEKEIKIVKEKLRMFETQMEMSDEETRIRTVEMDKIEKKWEELRMEMEKAKELRKLLLFKEMRDMYLLDMLWAKKVPDMEID